MADAIFEDPRLAAIYDPLDPDRSDLEVYAAIADELGATRVLDVGCGTGTFALLLAGRGLEVVGVDPSGASLAVARAKAGAERVRWIDGDATTLPPLTVDLATMTANVAQAIADEPTWEGTLQGVYEALRPGGHLVFETRDPAVEAWREWTRDASYSLDEIDDLGVVENWADLVDVSLPLAPSGGRSSFRTGRC
jgi:SAM-dependent methyltransferase